jgi:hypothetical protein
MSKIYSISKEDGKKLLEPYGQLFYDEIIGGFNDYKKYDLKRARIHDRTTKSNLVRSYVLERIKKLVAKTPTLKLLVQKRMVAILVEDKIIVRFKKLNRKFCSTNVLTEQVKLFRNRELLFQGIEALHVDAGWRVNKFYSEIDDVHFVCPNGKENLWRLPLLNLADKKIKSIFQVEETEVINIVTIKPGIANDDRKSASK